MTSIQQSLSQTQVFFVQSADSAFSVQMTLNLEKRVIAATYQIQISHGPASYIFWMGNGEINCNWCLLRR